MIARWLILALSSLAAVACTANGYVADGASIEHYSEPTRGFAAFDDVTNGITVSQIGDMHVGASLETIHKNSSISETERLMTYSAELAVEVPRAEDAVPRCVEVVKSFGGWVSRRDGGLVVCRVPAPQFENFLAEIRGFGRVLRDSVQAADVTDQHRDLTIRLDNAKRARERLLALLERADKVDDLLKIENEVRRLTVEIEQMTAELENLDKRVAYSIVAVQFSSLQPVDRPTRRRPSQFDWINSVGAEHVLRRF